MTIQARIWISDVNDKTDSISPDDCTLYEVELSDAGAFSRFILDRLEASEAMHGAVEEITFSVDEGRTINAYELDDPLGPGIDEWSFEEDDVQRLVDEYRVLMAKELGAVEAALCAPSANLNQALQAVLDAQGYCDKHPFHFKYFIAYLAYLIKAHDLASKNDLRNRLIETTPNEGIRKELIKALDETSMETLAALAGRFELDSIERYLENAWSDSPEGTSPDAGITGLEELTLKILDTQPNESVLNIGYGEGRLLLEIAKTQPTAQLIAIEAPMPDAAVAHIKLDLAHAKADEFPNERLASFRRKHEDMRPDKICEHADPKRGAYAFTSPSPINGGPLILLSDAQKAIVFTSRQELTMVPQGRKPIEEVIEAGILEAVVLLSDGHFIHEGIPHYEGLAMVIYSHGNDSVRIVDATEICKQAQEKSEASLRTLVPKECVAQILEALSEPTSFSHTHSLDDLAQAHFLLDPKIMPLSRESDEKLYPLSSASRMGGASHERTRGSSAAGNQARPDTFFKIGIDDIRDGMITSGHELAGDEVREVRGSVLIGPNGADAIDDNCVVIPLEHDATTGALSAGTVRAIKKAPADRTCFVDESLLLVRLDEERADAEKIAAFLNSERGQKLMDIALRRSEHAFNREKGASSGMFPMTFRDNLMINESAFEPGFDPAAIQRKRRPPRFSGSPHRPERPHMEQRQPPTRTAPPSRDARGRREPLLGDDEFDPTGALRGIAANPETPPELLDKLAHQANTSTQANVSRNPSASVETLIFLANQRTGAKAMLNPKLPASFLEEKALSADRFAHLREAAANPSTPARALEHLAHDDDEYVRETVAKNSATPASTLCALVHDRRPLVRKAALDNPRLPADYLEKLAAREKPALRYLAASSSQTSEDLLDSLAHDEDERVRREAATNKNMGADTLERLSHHPDPTTRMLVAIHPHTPASVVERLAHDDTVLGDGTSQVRFGATSSALAPIWLLEELADSDDQDIRYNLAVNERTPHHVLDKLAHDEDRSVRMALASNPAAPSGILEALSKDPDRIVRGEVAESPAALEETVLRLAADSEPYVRRKAAQRADLPPKVLEQLMEDEDATIRDCLAKNPSLPSEMRSKLAKDENSMVVATAVARLPHDELLRFIEESDAVRSLAKEQSE